MTFVVAEEEADGADEEAAVLAEHLGLVAVLDAVLVKAALLDDGVGVLGDLRFRNIHRDCWARVCLSWKDFGMGRLGADSILRSTQATC